MTVPTKLKMYLGTYLRHWMQMRKLTQAQAGKRLGLDAGHLNGLINYKRSISLEKLEAICIKSGLQPLKALITGQELLEKNISDNKPEPFFVEIDAFKTCLENGGGEIRMLTEMILKLSGEISSSNSNANLEPEDRPQSKSV